MSYQLLKSSIAHRTELLEKLKNDFNHHTREANSLQFRCERLAVELMNDRQRLRELEEELNQYPTLQRNF